MENRVTPELAEWLLVLGRALLGGLFVYGGATHFFALDQITAVIAERGVPMPRLVLIAGSLFQIAGGLLLMLGVAVPLAAAGLVLFTAAASFMMLDFWNKDGEQRLGLRSAFLANIAIVGGLLVAAATG